MTPKTSNKKIIIIARQAGAARAFVSLIGQLKAENWDIVALVFENARNVFESENLECKLIKSFNNALPILNVHFNAVILLSGTSENADEDSLFWVWAKTHKITSIAFVDSWVHYWQRFTSNGNEKSKFDLVPDKIAVIDNLMHKKMKKFGCNKGRLVITGNPAFDKLIGYKTQNEFEIQNQFGEYYLFVGEPFNEVVYGGKEREILGYTENEVLSIVLDSIEILRQKSGHKFQLVYKPHPRGINSKEVMALLKDKNIKIANTTFSPYDLCVCSNAVVGMTSILLYEAMLMGCKVISLRLGKKIENDIIDHQKRIIMAMNKSDLLHKLEHLLKQKKDIHTKSYNCYNNSLNFKDVLNKYIK